MLKNIKKATPTEEDYAYTISYLEKLGYKTERKNDLIIATTKDNVKIAFMPFLISSMKRFRNKGKNNEC